MKASGRKYLRRASRAASCSPEAKKRFLLGLTRQLEALEQDDPDADEKAIAAVLGSPEQAAGEYEAALPESDRLLARRHRRRVRIAVAAAVFAALAMLAAIFWGLWEAKKRPQITSTLVIYSSDPASGYWNDVENDEYVITYFEEEEVFLHREKASSESKK